MSTSTKKLMSNEQLSAEQMLETMAREGRLSAELVPLWENVKWARQHDLETALDEVEMNLRREVVMGEAERIATVLWIAHTYVYGAYKMTPRAFVTSGDPGCGKSTLLNCIAQMSNGGIYLTGATISHLGRVRREKGPDLTITLDQLDNQFDENAATTGPLIDRLIAGAERGSKIGLSEKINGNWTPVEVDISFPMALAKISVLPSAALRSRCIIIQMHPATAEEAAKLIARARGCADPNIRPLLAKVMRRVASDLATAKPSMPPKLINRGADKWRPLFAIAEAAGGDWPARALAAANELESDEEERPPHLTMLSKVATITRDWPHPVIFSDELDKALLKFGMSGSPTRWGAKPLSAKERANILKLVGVKPKPLWRDGKQLRGYRIADIREAAEKYLRPDTCDA